MDRNVSNVTIERWIIAICIVGALLCLWGVLDPSFGGWHPISRPQTQQPLVGRIASLENDTRRKAQASLQWDKALRDEKIRLGDSVFTGAYSRSRVALQDGGSIELGENSLVVFKHIHSIDIPNLDQGSVHLNVKDHMRIAIGGKIAEITGQQSELQIVVKKNEQPEIRLLSGSAQLRLEKPAPPATADTKTELVDTPIAFEESPMVLEPNETIQLELPVAVDTPTTPTAPVASFQEPPPPPPQPLILPQTPEQVFEHVDQLADFYDVYGGSIERRQARVTDVDQPVHLAWEVRNSTQSVRVQWSPSVTFSSGVKSETRDEPHLDLAQAALGDTYWRLSFDGETWSEIRKFTVRAHPLPETPRLRLADSSILILDHPAATKLKVRASEAASLVVEMANEPTFGHARVSLYTKTDPTLTFDQPGVFYLRVRTVNELNQVSAYSNVETLTVSQPERAPAPHLAQSSASLFEGELAKINWAPAPGASAYRVRLLREDGSLVKEKTFGRTSYTWPLEAAGHYRAEVVSFDAWERESLEPSVMNFEVRKPEIPAVLAANPKVDESKRGPSAIELSAQTVREAVQHDYAASTLQLEFAEYTMYSGEQLIKDGNVPSGLLATVRVQHWFEGGANGVQGSFTKALSGGDAHQTDPMNLEARYLHRWRVGWNPFAANHEFQIAALVALEAERNDGRGLYSPHYEILKAGFSLEIPILESWVTGGEALAGTWFDGSQKFEISGHLQYEFARNWALGGGYRVHLFQAGSESFAPAGLGLPYREAYGEAYSVLMWRY